jgi:hypothetical protein
MLLLALGLASGGVVSGAEKPRHIESVARQFRIQVYDTFRLERDEYDLRIEQGWKALNAFRQATTDEHREAIRDWFEQAILASIPDQADEVGYLPELPKFASALAERDSIEPVAAAEDAKPKDPDAQPVAHLAHSQPEETMGGKGCGEDGEESGDNQLHDALRFGRPLPTLLTQLGRALFSLGRARTAGLPNTEVIARPVAAAQPPAGVTPPAGISATPTTSAAQPTAATAGQPDLGAHAGAGPAATPPSTLDAVQLEADALNPRIAAHNLGVEALRKHFENHPEFDLNQLTTTTERLESLAARYSYLAKCFSLLPPESQTSLLKVDRGDDLAEDALRRLKRLEYRLASASTDDQSNRQEAQLSNLRSRLKVVSNTYALD